MKLYILTETDYTDDHFKVVDVFLHPYHAQQQHPDLKWSVDFTQWEDGTRILVTDDPEKHMIYSIFEIDKPDWKFVKLREGK